VFLCKHWAPFFEVNANTGGHFFPDFRVFAQIFSESKILGVRLQPLHPHPGADTGGDESPPPYLKRRWHDTWFIENHRQKYFCTAHYSL